MAGSAIGTVPPGGWLPSEFTTTHNTDGLGGYGAYDAFFPGGQVVALPIGGVVERVSGRSGQNYAGSIFGRSIYVRTDRGQRLFLTHFADPVFVRPGQRVEAGAPLGRVAPWRSGAPHIHMGVQGAPDTGGKVNLGNAARLDPGQVQTGGLGGLNVTGPFPITPGGIPGVGAATDWLIPDFLSFKNAYRIGEVVGGFVLVLLGLYMAGRRLGVAVPVPTPLRQAAGAGSVAASSGS